MIEIIKEIFNLLNSRVFVAEFILGIVSSLGISFLFWYYTFLKPKTKIKFHEKLLKSPQTNNIGVMFRNVGKRDLMELNVVMQLGIKVYHDERSRTTNEVTLFYVGNGGEVPLLRGKKAKQTDTVKTRTRAFSFQPKEPAYRELSVPMYPESIRKKAKSKTLVLNDIILACDEENSPIEIQSMIVFVFGNESFTGARRYFVKRYETKDIFLGRFDLIDFSFVPFEEEKPIKKSRKRKKDTE